MLKNGLVRIALLAVMVLLFQGTWALAGTTGALNGVVTLQDGTPIAGAKVTASSPSESVSTTTDTGGHFAFVSLIPDTYTVTASKDNYDTAAQSGISVFADNTAAVHISTQAKTRTLGVVTTTATAALVKPGTTADVYSVNAATQAKVAALGGGGGLDSAYSAIASVPGVVVPPGQSGWFQTIHIRGGDYDQVGYEFDGVPVLRSYDNYPTTNASALGQQELQVYTGAAPANSEAQGLAGYINQVIKTGTYPGSVTADFGIGMPSMYNKFNIEAGGATPDRNFSYFIGVGMYDQGYYYLDHHDGASVQNTWGTPLGALPCPAVNPQNFIACYANWNNGPFGSGQFGYSAGPGGIQLGPYTYGALSHIEDRENIVNLHFGIPHKNDAGKDDIQLLVDTSELFNTWYTSALDTQVPGAQFGYATNTLFFGQLNKPYPGSIDPVTGNFIPDPTKQIPYGYPSQSGTGFGAIPVGQRDGTSNGQGIVKLQYQHNIGSNAYFRLYGYTFYSDWLQNGPSGLNACCIGPVAPDYELSNHTRGVSATFADQINDKNLLNIEASVIGAYNYRDNNATPYAGAANTGILVDSTNPDNGVCYFGGGNVDSNGNYVGAAVPVSCITSASTATVNGIPIQRPSRIHATDTAAGAAGGATCGSGACEWLAVDNGFNGGANLGRPVFSAAAITDQIKPSDKLLLNIGLRYDRYDFKGSDTNTAPGTNPALGTARGFWFNAFNQDFCVSPVKGSTPQPKPGDPSLPCMDPSNFGGVANPFNPSGLTYAAAHITNEPSHTNSYSVTEPRFGMTYTLNTDNVLRFSYGRYAEAPNAAFQQYNVLQQNLALYDNRFQSTGTTATSRTVGPSISDNYDFSLEHHFANSDASFKLTPYYRTTKDQIQNFFLDQKTNFVSGLNAGKQTASGVEFQLNDGDFSRNGLAAQLSYTYTHSTIKFAALPNGTTVLDSINRAVGAYNAYTKNCAGNTTNSVCGGGLDSLQQVAAACYTPGGAPDATCAAGDISNPYWNAPVRPLFDPGASYTPFSTIPGGLNAASGSFITPNAFTLVVNYKHDKWALTPSLQFFSGGFYGAPLVTPGIDPAQGCAALAAGSTTGDKRYPYGGAGGAPYDAMTCNALLGGGIPNPFTANFDNLGAFKQPSQLLGHLQISYDATSRVTFVANIVNLIDTCMGGQTEPWTQYSDHRVCAYGLAYLAGSGAAGAAGNVFNPNTTFQPVQKYPYSQYFGVSPVQAYFEMKVKL